MRRENSIAKMISKVQKQENKQDKLTIDVKIWVDRNVRDNG